MTSAGLDAIIANSLQQFAQDALACDWRGKEQDWVNRYAHQYLLNHCSPDGPLRDPGQLEIEVVVPQPPGYAAPAVRRDLVIWTEPGSSCWGPCWDAVHHPICVLEWKVHRPKHRNRQIKGSGSG
jgi:hypothetical protein